jgi:hypothetical protein
MDFVTGLPSANGFDVIWVVIDHLTNLRYFAPYSSAIDAEGLTEPFLCNIFHLHGLLDTIGSDQGQQFALHFWKHICNSVTIEPHLSTTFHREIDGQTKPINAIME